MLPQLLYPQGNFLNIKDTASSPTDYNIRVAGAGDIVSTKVLKELINTFTMVEKETIVMTMEKESKDE